MRLRACALVLINLLSLVCGHRAGLASRSEPLEALQTFLVSTNPVASRGLRSSSHSSTNSAAAQQQALLRLRGGDGETIIESLTSETELEGVLELAGNALVVVDFYADWCGPCKQLAPHLEKLARTTSPDKVLFYKCNADQAQDVLRAYDVSMLPTLKLFKNGKLIKTIVGAEIGTLSAEIAKATSNPLVRLFLSARKNALLGGTAAYLLMPWHKVRPGWSSIYRSY